MDLMKCMGMRIYILLYTDLETTVIIMSQTLCAEWTHLVMRRPSRSLVQRGIALFYIIV